MAKKSDASYQKLREELEDVIDAIQQEDLDVDKAVELYKRGLELVRCLERYLQAAENTVSEIKATFDGGTS